VVRKECNKAERECLLQLSEVSEMKEKGFAMRVAVIGLFLLGGWTAGTVGQSESSLRSWEPGAYGEETISLMEAVRLTLDHSPAVQLQKEVNRFQHGLFQEASGAFDSALLADLSYDYSREGLKASTFNRLKEERDDLQEDFEEAQRNLLAGEAGLAQLRALQLDPSGATLDKDPTLQAIIDLFNAEIAAASNAEARRQLLLDRDRAIADAIQELTDLVGELTTDLADVVLDQEKLGPTPTEQERTSGLLNLSISKPTRRGFTLGPFFEYTSETDNFIGKPVDPELGGKGFEDLYRATLGFNFDTPLARGLGVKSAGAGEKAAELEFEASLLALKHVVAENIFSTALSYWDSRAAQETVAILEESARIQSELVETTRALIRADELPAAELARAQAGEADAMAALDAARRRALQARLGLSSVIGLKVESMGGAPVPADDFPTGLESSILESVDLAMLIADAVEHRDDYQSARLREESGGVLLTAARSDLKPRVDLATKAWYNALGEGSAGEPFSADVVGPSYNLKLDIEWPFANNTQEGRFVQARAGSSTRSILAADLDRVIRTSVLEVLGSLEQTVEQLLYSQEAVEHYRRSLSAEVEKYSSGAATLIDTLLTEQRLTEALLAEVAAKRQYARLLAQFGFETGRLMTESADGGYLVDRAALVKPSIQQAPDETSG